MGTIHIDLFCTLDGVAQAPGGPDEDPEGGFPFGGWQAPLLDEVTGREIQAHLAELDALLLGRRTYDIFAGYWPHREQGQDNLIARQLNRVPKYVASRGTPDLTWAGSRQLGPDLAAEVAALRDRHESIHVIGSVNLVQTLFAHGLFDRFNLWVYPVVLGTGKKVFPDGAAASRLTLLEPPLTSTSGAVWLRYGPLPGPPGTGDMSQPGRGVE